MAFYTCPKCKRQQFVPSGREGAKHECPAVGCNNMVSTGSILQKAKKLGQSYVFA